MNFKAAAWLGFAGWLIPFVVSVIAFPLKQANAPAFNTFMALVVLLTGGLLLRRYFRGRPVYVREALLVGIAWCAVSLILDYPMFAYGPMQMPFGTYYSEIGFGYLAFPTLAYTSARLAQ